jgi:hypothetical protein
MMLVSRMDLKAATVPQWTILKAGVADDSRPGCCTYYFKPQIIDFGSNATKLFCIAQMRESP